MDLIIFNIFKKVTAISAALLAAFKAKIDRALDLVALFEKYFCRAQKHRGVSVVSAGVHNAVHLTLADSLAFEVFVGLLNRKSVHIGAQEHRSAVVLFSADHAENAAVFDLHALDTHSAKLLEDLFDGVEFLGRKLGIFVQITARVYYILLVFLCQINVFHFLTLNYSIFSGVTAIYARRSSASVGSPSIT